MSYERQIPGGIGVQETGTFEAQIPGGIGVQETFSAPSGSLIKTWHGIPIAQIKTINGIAIANIKSWNGIANV